MKSMGSFSYRCFAFAAAITAVVAMGAGQAQADSDFSLGDFSLGFVKFNGSGPDLGAQFTLEASDIGGGLVTFKLSNAGPANSSITRLYIQDGDDMLSSPSVSDGSPDTQNWVVGSSSPPPTVAPADLSGGNDIGFETDYRFGYKNTDGTPANGVNPNQFVTIRFWLDGSNTFADLFESVENNQLRFGLQVQSIDGGHSSQYINTPPGNVVPLPAAAWGGLALLGMLGVGQRVRRRLTHAA